jgi:hypothetical protein
MMLITYVIYMVIAVYSYSSLSDYLNLRSGIVLVDAESSK